MPEPLSIKTIWGKAVLYLREHKNVALHVVCGDITDVELNGDKLVLKTTEQFLFDMISSEESIAEIKKALNWQGFNYELEIVKVAKDEDNVKDDLNKLKKYNIKYNLK